METNNNIFKSGDSHICIEFPDEAYETIIDSLDEEEYLGRKLDQDKLYAGFYDVEIRDKVHNDLKLNLKEAK